jgi:hypothetical protein
MTRPIDLQQNSLRLEPIRRNRTVDQAAAAGLSSERYGNGKLPRRASQTSSSDPESAQSPADDTVGNSEDRADGSIDYLA